MEATHEIGVVIVGAAGNRGRSGLEMLPKLSAQETTKGISLLLVGVAEARQEFRADLVSHVTTMFGFSRPVVGTLVEAIPHALRWLDNGERQRKLIIYDASPTAHHYLHLMTVLPHSKREHIYYLGEKPLFTKEGQVEFVAHNFPDQTFFLRIHRHGESLLSRGKRVYPLRASPNPTYVVLARQLYGGGYRGW